MAKKNNNKSAIRKDSDKKVSRLNRAIYSATDPTYGYPTGLGIPAVGGRAGVALFNPDDMWYEVTDSVADAAWRKRLGLSYDDKFLIENKNGSFRLPKDVEMEIPTDTTALKRRIQANKKLADSPEIMGDDWKLVQGMIDADEKTLNALRRTYETGEPVVINEYSHNSRKLAKDGKIIEGADNYKSPLNVLQNYTVQYNPKNRTMMYRDTYDFNGFESFVPGEPFDIEGEIPLNRKYFIGGLLEGAKGLNDNLTTKFMGSSLGKGLSSIGVKSGGLGGIANTAATAIGGLLAGKNKTGVGNALQGIGSLASNIPGVGGLIGAGVNLVGGLVNAAFGSNINEEFVNQTEAQARQQSNYVSGASDNAALLSDWSSLSLLGDINKSDVGSDGWFSNKAKRETNRLNTLVDEANMRALASISNTAENIDKQNDLMLMANYSAYGGPIDMKYTGVMSPFGNQFKDGGIYIKPSKRGTFTAAAKKRGMGVQEFASKVLANKEDYSPAMVKKANFARNASKWKHDDGGQLFTNGVTTIGNGGTHESNPYEGVQMGIDPQGIPNLVEEGEVIYDDYVFSNRLRVPKEVRQKYKLRGVTFADAAKQLQKESEERPNDPISKNGLNASMSMLQQEQETVRMKKESNKYAKGGKLGKLYEGEGPYSQYLELMPKKELKFNGLPNINNTSNLSLKSPIGTTSIEQGKSFVKSLVERNKGKYNDFKNKIDEEGITNEGIKNNWLRYAPIAGHAIGAFSDLFSSPDYSAANAIEAVDITPATVGYTPVGNYLSYKPFDRDYYLNKLNADVAATRRAVTNTSGGNRAAAMAGLLAADYNYGNQLGALARQAEEYNQALRERVEGFNRQTNLANAEMGLKAAMANAESRNQATKLRLSQAGQAAAMRKAAKDAYDTRRSNNINVLLEELGGLGTENWNRDWLDRLAKAGVLKIDSKGNPVISSAKGGKIRTKKKKGFIYG